MEVENLFGLLLEEIWHVVSGIWHSALDILKLSKGRSDPLGIVFLGYHEHD